jgi:hypothetical protein
MSNHTEEDLIENNDSRPANEEVMYKFAEIDTAMPKVLENKKQKSSISNLNHDGKQFY